MQTQKLTQQKKSQLNCQNDGKNGEKKLVTIKQRK